MELKPIACTYCRGVIMINTETVGPAYLTYEKPESIECTDCDATWEPDGTPRDAPRWDRYPLLYQPPEHVQQAAGAANSPPDDPEGRPRG